MNYDDESIDWHGYALTLEQERDELRKQLVWMTARLETAGMATERLKTVREFEAQHPEEVFAELTEAEWEKITKALSRTKVRAPCDRMRASWIRQFAKHILNGKAKKR